MSGPEETGTVRVTTPEGVDLTFRLADLGHRAIAFVVDGGIILAGIVVIILMAIAVMSLRWGEHFVLGAVIVAIFLLQSFYFVVFELRWQGSTPGKRIQKVRVISRDGGPLTVGMVFARNLTRQVELTIPVVVMLAPSQFAPEAPVWTALVAVVWAGVLLFFPALNRQRARLGDLAAGTLVIAEPKAVLEPDLARTEARVEEADLVFTPAQLEIYGNRELQTLETILRSDPTAETAALLETVAEKIQRKIGWEPPAGGAPVHARRFLVAFYAAQRRRLEHKLVLGRPQEEKVDGTRS
jgi:uncharacterized RDD family membrane protein YckC